MVWNKGYTKYTNTSVMKTSQTIKSKHIDNFKSWREGAKEIGIIPEAYPEFIETKELAELIGVVLGDGNISSFPRTQRLIITSNSNNVGFIQRYATIIKVVFNKTASIQKVKATNATRISFLRGLFEAEGSLLKTLGYHPERRDKGVRLRKKHEALDFEKLIKFRVY